MKIAILTSGGDAPGMNVAIRAVVRYSLQRGHQVYGVYNGYRGLVTGDIVKLDHKSVSGKISKGGTFLKTARMEGFDDIELQKQAIKNLEELGIEALVVIGGDGSFRGAMALNKLGIKTIGIPGTIDNDIYGTDYTLGFHTAVETVVEAIDKLRDTSQSHQRCSIVETMGRNCGDLALYAGISGGAEFIVTPENPLSKEFIINRLREYKAEERTHAIVVVTEKIYDVHELATEITRESKFTSRATVLGYIQRGGLPCPEDRILGSRMGVYAVELLERGIYGVAVGVRATKMTHLPFEEVFKNKRPYNELYELVTKVS